jgi:hypothetical protein
MTYLANDAVRDLVSLALISEDGWAAPLLRRTQPSSACTLVVRSPDGLSVARTRCDCSTRSSVHPPAPLIPGGFPVPPVVLADGMLDFSMLRLALSGFGVVDEASIPAWQPELVTDRAMLDHIEAYFSRNADARARRHHAMVDAEPLRWAHTG